MVQVASIVAQLLYTAYVLACVPWMEGAERVGWELLVNVGVDVNVRARVSVSRSGNVNEGAKMITKMIVMVRANIEIDIK